MKLETLDEKIVELGKDYATNKLYIMVGNIGSGKSTYITNNLKHAKIVSKDSIRYGIGGGNYIFDPSIEHIIHDTTVFMTDKLCRNGVSDIVIDETNVQAKGRKTWIDIGKKYGYEIIAISLPKLPKEFAVARRLTNPHCQPDIELWNKVWTKFDNRYKEPTLEEGFDEIRLLLKEDVI